MRDELITALLRALPKAIRRHVVPAADWAAKFAEELEGQGPEEHDGLPPTTLRDALARLASSASRISRSPRPTSSSTACPATCSSRSAPSTSAGAPSAPTATWPTLQERLSDRARDSVAALERAAAAEASAIAGARSPASGRRHPRPTSSRRARRLAERTGLTDWDFGDLPEVVDTQGRRRRRARLPGARRRGLERRAARRVDAGGRGARHPRGRPAAPAAGRRLARRRTCWSTSPRPRSSRSRHPRTRRPGRSSRTRASPSRMPSSRAPAATRVVRTRADFERVRDAVSAAVVDETFQPRLARRPHPDGGPRGRARAARAELADAARRAERRARASSRA